MLPKTMLGETMLMETLVVKTTSVASLLAETMPVHGFRWQKS